MSLICRMVKPSNARGRRPGRDMCSDAVAPLGVAVATPIQSGQPQRVRMTEWIGVPVLDVKEIETLAEHLCLVIGLDPQALASMQAAKPTLQEPNNLLVGG